MQKSKTNKKVIKEVGAKAAELIESLRKVDTADLPDIIVFVHKGVKVDITEQVYRGRV